ncbi:hypothetical protein GV67_10710 [Pseudorhizobium pelagicum]|uniref:AB hydrolase-1 domain-containing protein n=2 Tax=Pseudorhizobium pelagicum TaxID=1509405 RepID=A0A922TA82_9HYPH|nr:hypothetical protein GV67_10710 [Pseudorhizobium pelagicum]KEQ09959.1 hypothetical protein GV68_21730 [Pseudorhizobium pelagicum]
MMTSKSNLGILFLHALPLDGSMWAAQRHLLPNSSYAPTLYGFGQSAEEWAAEALSIVKGKRLIVVGCSVGGSCALEVAALAPDRVAALILIGTKARHRPDPEFREFALEEIAKGDRSGAWATFWEPLFSKKADPTVIDAARQAYVRLPKQDILRGVNVFHTRRSRDDTLAAFPGPVVFVSGAEDIAPGPEKTAAQALTAQDGMVEIIPDCGHYVPLEKPDQLSNIVRRVIYTLEVG